MSQIVNGIAVNPALPKNFDSTPNDQRPDSHHAWWHRPYVVTDRWQPESYHNYCERLARLGYEPDYTFEEWQAYQDHQEVSWLEAWPSGVRYNVRCLDGGAWDRSTNYGSFPSLDAALEVAGKLGNVPDFDDEPEPGPR